MRPPTGLVSLWNRLRAVARRDALADEIAEEMRFHREMLERDLGAPSGARRFGNQTFLKEESREMWSLGSIEVWMQDVRYAVRFLRRSPVFALVAVLSLALGIGANTAVFTLIDAVLLKSLPVHDPQSLVLLQPVPTGTDTFTVFAYPYFKAIESQNTVFSGMFASAELSTVTVDAGHGTETLPSGALLVTGGYFPVLGVQPALGRLLSASDDVTPGGHPVVVLSYGYWQRAFGGDSSALGRTLDVNGAPLTVVGVTPSDFFGTQVGSSPDVYVPIMMDVALQHGESQRAETGDWWIDVMARLKPGVTREQAAAQLAVLLRRGLRVDRPSAPAQVIEAGSKAFIVVTDASRGLEALSRRFSKPLIVLGAMAALVLLIACTNLASLLVSRAAARRREIAVRLSLGAGRARLVRQLLTESALLSILGAAAGLLVAEVGDRALLGVIQTGRRALDLSLHPDGRVLAFTIAVSIVTTLLFGVVPAVTAARVDVAPALKEDSGGSGRSRGSLRLGKTLVVTQVALSVLLLFGATLFVRSLRRLESVNLGFRHDKMLIVRLNPRPIGYSGPRLAALYDQLLARTASIPGVQSAAFVSHPPFGGGSSSFNAPIEGYRSPTDEPPEVTRVIVSANYFQQLGIPLRQGRLLTGTDEGDGGWPRAVVVNETFAKKFGGETSVVGRHINLPGKPIEIVGVVGDATFNSVRREPPPVAYWLIGADSMRLAFGSLVLRTDRPLADIGTDIRSAIASVDRRLPIVAMRTFDAQIDATIANERAVALLSGFFGVLALVLAMVGLYGIMSYTVTRRTREFGVRMALGASGGHVVELVLRETLVLVAAGVLLGIPAALLAGRVGASLLYDLSPTDPLTLVVTTGLLVAVAAVAGLIPARRAAAIDPLLALRAE